MLYALCVDSAVNDLGDWIEVSEVSDADELGRDITSQCEEGMLNDVSGDVAAWQKSHKMKTDRRMTYPACNPHSAVSRNWQICCCVDILLKLRNAIAVILQLAVVAYNPITPPDMFDDCLLPFL